MECLARHSDSNYQNSPLANRGSAVAAFSRRRFLHTGATALGTAMIAPQAFAAARFGKANLVLSGGIFYSMDPNVPEIGAIAIRGKRILAVGSQDDIAALIGPDTRVMDTTGMTVTPGFIDAHSHPLMANEAVSVNVNYRRISEVQAALRAKAARTPTGHWVQGHMYDDTKFTDGRPMNRADLDAVSTDHPVFILHRGGHTAVVNSRAFDVAGLTIDTPDPTGGAYYRESGQFTGRIAELALNTFWAAGTWPAIDRAANQENVRLITRRIRAPRGNPPRKQPTGPSSTSRNSPPPLAKRTSPSPRMSGTAHRESPAFPQPGSSWESSSPSSSPSCSSPAHAHSRARSRGT